MKTVVDKIIASIGDAVKRDNGKAIPVYYHDEPDLNLIADAMDFPCAFVQLLSTSSADYEAGQLKETVTAAVFFVEPSEFDFDAVENERIIERCRRRAFRWLLALPNDKYFSVVSVNRMQRAYERFDAILTGFGVMISLRELEGFIECLENTQQDNQEHNQENGAEPVHIVPEPSTPILDY